MKRKGRIIVKEGYGAGFSVNNGGLGGTSRGGFGGASNIGAGGNSMYTYEIKPLNHSLEQRPTTTLATEDRTVSIGTKITGLPLRSNATPDKKKITGIVHIIKQTDDSALMYYVVQDEATQEMVKIDPLTAQVIVAEPVEYYDDVKDMPSRRKEKIKAFKQNLVPESLQESLINKEITNTAIKIINSAERDGYLTGMEVSANYVTDAAKKIAKEYDKLPEEEKLTLRNSYYRKFLKSIHKA